MDLGKWKEVPLVVERFILSKTSTFPPEKQRKNGLPVDLYHMILTGTGYDARMFKTGAGYVEILAAIKEGINATGSWQNGASNKDGLKALDLILGGHEGRDRFTQEQRLNLYDALVQNVKAKGIAPSELVSSHTARIAVENQRWKIIPKLVGVTGVTFGEDLFASASAGLKRTLAMYTPSQKTKGSAPTPTI